MTTSEERLSRLEGAYDHLATKADVESVRVAVATLTVEMARLETRLIKWIVGTVVTGKATAAAVVVAIERLFEQ